MMSLKLAGFAAVAVTLPLLAPLQDPSGKPQPQPQPVKVVRGDLTVALELDGWFEPVRAQEIAIRPQGLQAELVVASAAAHGSRVRKGDTLIAVDTKDADRAIAAADDELRLAESAAAKAEQELDFGARGDALALERGENERRLAEEKLRSYKDFEAPQDRAERELALLRGQDSIDNQREELDQLKKMYSSEELTNATAEIVVKRAERNLERSLTSLDFSKRRFKRFVEIDQPEETKRLELALRQKELDIERLKESQANSKLQRESDSRRDQREAAQKRERLEKLRADRAALSVTASFDGAVYVGQLKDGRWSGTDAMARLLKPGERIPAGAVVMTLVEPGELRFRGALREADWARAAEGLAAEIAPTAFSSEKLKGATGAPAETASQDGSFEVSIRLADGHARLVGGMRGKARITLKELKGVLLLPAAVVFEEGGAKKVRTSDGAREVKVGETDGKMVEIVGGLAEGDEVQPK